MPARSTKSTAHARGAGSGRQRDWKPKFLKAFAETGRVGLACEVAGISRATSYKARQADEDFALQWAEVERTFLDALERKAYERALDGSDRLLEFLLKAHRPEVYGERTRIEHSGGIDSSVRITERQIAPATLPIELQKQIAAIARGDDEDD
jgi:hypothetical protein